MDGLLSQEEIDVLLKGANAVQEETTINDMEKDVLGEIANISMGTAATALSSLLGKKTSITTPKIKIVNIDQLIEEYSQDYLTVTVNYTNVLKGTNVLLVHTRDAGVLVDLMTKGDGSNPPQELTELHLNAIGEAMDQMMNASVSALNQVFNKTSIEISSPVVNIMDFNKENFSKDISDEDVIIISFALSIEGLVDSELLQILPVSFAKQIVSELCQVNGVNGVNDVNNEPNKGSEFNNGYEANMINEPKRVKEEKSAQVEVAMAKFPVFEETKDHEGKIPSNLDLIMDINLQLSVELGRANKKISEILKLTSGSIVELDKLAGEPVDILVNNRLLAKGEVIIIDENFGVRVTEIISPSDRIKNLE